MGRVISIDQVACSGCQSCVELCPEGFAFDQEREVAVARDAADICEDELQQVLSICPEACISIQEE